MGLLPDTKQSALQPLVRVKTPARMLRPGKKWDSACRVGLHGKAPIVRRSRDKHAGRPIPKFYFTDLWRSLREYTLERDHHICQYCGSHAFQADHVIPRRQGGTDSLDNLVACCLRCNRIAGGLLFDSFAQKRRYIRCEVRQKKGKSHRL